jgi:hypothetical protein
MDARDSLKRERIVCVLEFEFHAAVDQIAAKNEV